MKLGFVIHTHSELRNTTAREMKSHKTVIVPNRSCVITYLIDDRRALWDLHDRRALWDLHDRQALWDFHALWDFYAFSVSGFQRKRDKSSMRLLVTFWAIFLNFVGLFSRDENFVIFYQGLWAEKIGAFFFSHLFRGCFNLFWVTK